VTTPTTKSEIVRLPTPAPGTIRDVLQLPSVIERFEEVLNDRAASFLGSLAGLVISTPTLRDCEPESFITSALTAASLDLSIDPHLGFAFIIPYNDNRTGKKLAKFQMGYKGYIQLAIRTGQYRILNATEVYYGEIKSKNRITGEIVWGERDSETIVGYAASLRLHNGFEKTLYMTVEELQRYGAKHSKGYGKETSRWKTDPPSMFLKTVIKQLLTKWGVLSVEMQQAIEAEKLPEDEFSHEGTETILDAEQRAQDKQALYPEEEPPTTLTEDEMLFCGNVVKKNDRVGNLVNTEYRDWFKEHVFSKFNHRKHYDAHLLKHFGVHSAANLTYEMLVAMSDQMGKGIEYSEQWRGEEKKEDKLRSLGLEKFREDESAHKLTPEALQPILDKIVVLVENKTFDPNTLEGMADLRSIFNQDVTDLLELRDAIRQNADKVKV